MCAAVTLSNEIQNMKRLNKEEKQKWTATNIYRYNMIWISCISCAVCSLSKLGNNGEKWQQRIPCIYCLLSVCSRYLFRVKSCLCKENKLAAGRYGWRHIVTNTHSQQPCKWVPRQWTRIKCRLHDTLPHHEHFLRNQ